MAVANDTPHVVLINYGLNWDNIDIKVVGNFRSRETAERWISEQQTDAESVDVQQMVPLQLRDPAEGVTDWMHRPGVASR